LEGLGSYEERQWQWLRLLYVSNNLLGKRKTGGAVSYWGRLRHSLHRSGRILYYGQREPSYTCIYFL